MKHELILLYNIHDRKRRLNIELALFPLGVQIRYIRKEEYAHPTGYFAECEGIHPSPAPYTGPELDGEMMVFCDIDDNRLSQIFSSFKAMHISPVKCKAVLTETNQLWPAPVLYQELFREHKAIKKHKR